MNFESIQYTAIKRVISRLLCTKREIDICELYFGRIGGIGYNELRFCGMDENHQLTFESNNVHDYSNGEDIYKIFHWEELSDYEKDMLYHIFSDDTFFCTYK